LRRRLIVDSNRCTGCEACVDVCTMQNNRIIDPSRSRLWISKDEAKAVFVPFICQQCESAPCERACPVGAITRHPETQAYVVDRELCNGCKMCVWACPFSVIRIDDEGKCAKCEYCGGVPACAIVCAPGALKWGDIDDPENIIHWDFADRRSRAEERARVLLEESGP
jgi:Fe-S-cluster-containing dehydrogenase component